MIIKEMLLVGLTFLLLANCKKTDTPETEIAFDWELVTFSTGGSGKHMRIVEFFGNETFFIGGITSSIYPAPISYYSSDNGVSWSYALGSAEGTELTSIGKVNDSSAYILSDSFGAHQINYTNNYCQSFATNNLSGMCYPDSFEKVGMHFFNDTVGLVQNKRTEDGGDTWECLSIPFSKNYFFLNNSTGYSCAGNSLYKTTDTGITWEELYVATESTREAKFFDETKGLLLAGPDLLKTNNGGADWTIVNTGVSSFFFINTEKGFITKGDQIYKTIDSGSTWTLVFESDKIQFYDLTYNGQVAIAVGKQKYPEEREENFVVVSTNP